MKKLIHKLSAVNQNILIISLFVLIDLIFFWKYFLLGLIPIPADVIIGSYYPWLNEKWGYAVGVPVKNALMSDVFSLLYPWRLLAINYMKSGQLPLWDNTSFLGMSLIGNFQAGIFNPFNLLFFLPFSFNKIWGLQVVIQPLIAMISMYFLLKEWKVSRASSVFGALCYAFSAQITVWIEYNIHGFILCIFPLFILVLDKFIKTGKLAYFSFVSLIVAFVIFAGYPQHIYYFTLFGFVYIIFFTYLNNGWRKIFLPLIAYFSFILLGLGLSAVSLFPGFESLNLSIKSLDKVAEGNSVLFLPLQNLLTGLVPDFFGNPATNNYFGIGYYESLIFYTSIVALPFAFIMIPNFFKNRVVAVNIIFLVLVLLLALQTPVSLTLQYFSFLGLKGSVSARVLFVYGFSVSVLASFGFDRFIAGQVKEKTYVKFFVPLVMTGITAGLLLSYSFTGTVLGGFGQIPREYEKLIISLRNTVIPFGLVIAVYVIFFLSRLPRIRPLLIVFIFCLLLFDSYKFSSKYLPFVREDLIFPETPLINYLKAAEDPVRIAVEKGELLPANTWSVYGLESISGYNILLSKNTADYINFLNTSELRGGYSRFVDVNNLNSPLLDAANVKFLITLMRKDGSPSTEGGPPYNLDTRKYKRVFTEEAVAVYENLDFLPRYRTVSEVISSVDKEGVYALMSSGNFDFNKTAVVESGKAVKGGSECQLETVNYAAQSASLQAECPGESFLVMSQLYYPGWKIKVNGTEVESLKANGVFTGIALPAGLVKIDTYYFPDSFRIGIWISVTSLAVLVGINTLNIRKRKIL